MKILIVRTHPTEINIDTYNVQEIGLAKALIKKGHECDIVLYTEKDDREETYSVEKGNSIRIYWLKGKNVFWQGIFDKKRLIGIAEGYDFIQTNEYSQVASFFLIQKLRDRTFIYHGPYYNPEDKKYNLLNKAFDVIYLKRMTALKTPILAKSKLAQQTLEARGFSNVTTVGVGLDTDRFGVTDEMMQEKILDRAEFHSSETITLLYIGEISKRRNSLFLLKVFSEVVRKTDRKVVLRIIGKGEDEYMESFNAAIEEYQLEERLEYTPRMSQKELAGVYQEADIFLFPTNYDIFGMVLLEAMYFGLAVVSSVNGGSVTLIENEGEGIIVEKYEEEKWSNAILSLIENPDQLKRMRQNAHMKIQDNFTWDAIAEKVLAVCENMKQGNR